MATRAELQSKIDALNKALQLARQQIAQIPPPTDLAIVVEAARKLEGQINDLQKQIDELATKEEEKAVEAEKTKTKAAQEKEKAETSNTTSTETDTKTKDDDKGSDTSVPTANNQENEKIIETDGMIGSRTFNPLSRQSSYTYNLSLRVATPSVYNRYMLGDKNALTEAPLLIRSGGSSEKRAPGFELDFFIDELEIKTKSSSKETQTATNTIDYRFKIFEPYGFTFTNNLVKLRNNGSIGLGAFRGSYFLTIEFYGYGTTYGDIGTVITGAPIHSRTFCIYITQVSFRLEKGLVVYDVTARQFGQDVAYGDFGLVKGNKSIQGKTVEDILKGNKSSSSVISLVDVLNKDQEDKVKTGEVEVANIYAIEFWDDDIASSTLVSKENISKNNTPIAKITKPDQVNERTSYQVTYVENSAVDLQTRVASVTSGEPILKVIDNIISQSSYVRDSLRAYSKEEPTDPLDDVPIPNTSQQRLTWYNVSPKVEFLTSGSGPDGLDVKRNQFAYKITYIVQKYEIPFVRAVYSDNIQTYYGPYKQYDYWYTGKNTEVISFDVTYNYSYQVEVSMASDVSVSTSNLNGVPIQTGGGVAADNSSKEPGTNEEVNSIRSWLYSPGELTKFSLSILGDPDYLMPAFNGTIVDQAQRWYGEDYTINPNTRQIFIEIDFKQAEDYDLTTGLLKIDDKIKFMDYAESMNPKPKGIVFCVNEVTSTFSRGRFEQRITGSLPNFTGYDKATKNTNKERVSGAPGEQDNVTGVDEAVAAQAAQNNETLASNPPAISTTSSSQDDDNQKSVAVARNSYQGGRIVNTPKTTSTGGEYSGDGNVTDLSLG